MTNLTRKIATTAAAVVIAAGLVAGFATPALAATTGLPIPGPVRPGPSVPPLPPGFDPRPALRLPTCATILTWFPGVDTTSGWGDPIAPGDQIPRNIARAERHLTCVYSTGAWTTFVTIAAMPTADYSAVTAYYAGRETRSGGTAPEPGYAIDKHYYLYGSAIPAGSSGDEQSFISPDGWWVSVSTFGAGSSAVGVTSIIRDAVTRLLAQNPLRQ